MTVKCEMCGAEFETSGHWAKFCPECRAQKKKDYAHKAYLKQLHGAETAERYLAAEKQRKELNEVLHQAEAAGLTYGQYVAAEERKKEAMDKKNEAAKVPKPEVVRLLIAKAEEALKRSEVDCKEIGEAVGLLTAAEMLLGGDGE